MFGKRFSISASIFAVAGACSVMFSSPVTLAQRYQQTRFPGYARPQLSELSAAATDPPTFSDNVADRSSMSPNSWGESAISNPYAGYTDTPKYISNQSIPTAVPTYVTQQQTPNQSATQAQAQAESADFFAPTTLTLNSLPKNRKSTSSSLKSKASSASSADALTNTRYERTEMLPSVFSNAGYTGNNSIEPTDLPEFPKIEFQAQTTESVDFDKTPSDSPTELRAPAPEASLEAPLFNEPAPRTPEATILDRDPVQPRASIENVISPETPGSDSRVDTLPTSNLQPSVEQPVQQFQTQQTLQRKPQHVPSQPIISEQAIPLFSPTQDQPVYFQQHQPTYFQPQYSVQPAMPVSHSWRSGYQGAEQMQACVGSPANAGGQGFGMPAYRWNIGQRTGYPTTRNQTILDQGESFDHENKKKEFPPFAEIIATGRFFGSVELAYLRPHFLGNTAISIDGPTFSESIPFEFENETAPKIRAGFESKYGPGFELNYFTLNANSRAISQTFDGLAPVSTIASVTGPNRFSQLSADAIGETLNANHSFEIETIGFNVFKDIAFKVSRIGGRFGFTYANIAQSLESSVTDGGDNILDSLVSTSDFRGFGPQLGIDYYRPMGHTPLEFVTSFSGMGLFGRRDQFVNNTAGLVERRFGADEFVAVLDLTSGIQYKKTIAENRAWFARLAFVHQTWLGGGTAVDPTGDFGMKGVTFGVGYNR